MMKTAMPLDKIQQQLLLQLSSFFFISDEDKMLINDKMGGQFYDASVAFLALQINITPGMAFHFLIHTNQLNTRYSCIIFPM